jgi:hypothetical protein
MAVQAGSDNLTPRRRLVGSNSANLAGGLEAKDESDGSWEVTSDLGQLGCELETLSAFFTIAHVQCFYGRRSLSLGRTMFRLWNDRSKWLVLL